MIPKYVQVEFPRIQPVPAVIERRAPRVQPLQPLPKMEETARTATVTLGRAGQLSRSATKALEKIRADTQTEIVTSVAHAQKTLERTVMKLRQVETQVPMPWPWPKPFPKIRVTFPDIPDLEKQVRGIEKRVGRAVKGERGLRIWPVGRPQDIAKIEKMLLGAPTRKKRRRKR